MKKMYLLVALVILSWQTASAYTQDELRWKDASSGVLRYGEYMTGKNAEGEYKVKVVDFPPPVKGERNIDGNIVPEIPVVPSVMLALYKTTKEESYLIETFPLGKDGYKIVNDEARIVIDELPDASSQNWVYEYYDPWVNLTLQLIDVPDFEITIDMPKTTFGYDDDLAETMITVNNTGSYAKNIDVLIDTEGLKLIKGLRRETFSYIDKNDSVSYNVSIEIPKILQGSRSYVISVVAAGYDIRGKSFSNSESKKIVVGSGIGPLEVVKFNKSVKDRVYVGDNVLVSLSLQNNGKFSIDSAMVEDVLNGTDTNFNGRFVLLGNASMKWHTTVLSGNIWTADYLVKPLEPGKYTFPSARANVSIYGIVYEIYSNTPEIDVYGSKISISKSATYSDGKLRVSIRVRNTGNIPTTIYVEDRLPENVTIVQGDTRLSTLLGASLEKYFSYEARVSMLENYTLPVAVAYYTIGEYKEIVLSNVPTVAVYKEPVVTPINMTETKEEKEQYDIETVKKELKKEPAVGWDKIAGAVILLTVSAAVIYALKRRK